MRGVFVRFGLFGRLPKPPSLIHSGGNRIHFLVWSLVVYMLWLSQLSTVTGLSRAALYFDRRIYTTIRDKERTG